MYQIKHSMGKKNIFYLVIQAIYHGHVLFVCAVLHVLLGKICMHYLSNNTHILPSKTSIRECASNAHVSYLIIQAMCITQITVTV